MNDILDMTAEDQDLYLSYVGTMEGIERELASQPPAPVEPDTEALAELAELFRSLEPLPDLRDGACVGSEDPDLFFREGNGSKAKARGICLGCPVRFECSTVKDQHGVWGGLDKAEAKPCKRGHVGQRYRRPNGAAYCKTCKSEARTGAKREAA